MAKNRERIDELAAWIDPYRVTDGANFRLKNIDPSDTRGLKADKSEAQKRLATGVEWLAAEQDTLYAQDRRSLLLIFQAMDAAGKDSTIKHVMSGVNPQGVQVVAFKQPSSEELDHDWMWRCYRHLPERGRIGIFNRSYYEEVLVVRVHQEILRAQKLPPECVGKDIFDQRLRDIAAIEDYLVRNGTTVVKFFLHVSRKEQRKRFLERIDEPSKNWKFSSADVKERAHWDEYMDAYEAAIQATATPHAPWFVVPADSKWFTRLVVVGAIVEALEKMQLKYPTIDKSQRAELELARKLLVSEKK
ncbi:MAG TPA: polyphosphate kinase 2 family protein [Burkholderiaceae bacterium]|jgi:PPK2 family polyphosphate:nucleotide phosphotransferase|nr:polyphosphate kinase 2 family protein [Burkholderiaceae bacterium]